MRAGWRPERRNRNIGTFYAGWRKENKMVVPNSRHDEFFFYERLGLPGLENWALQGSPWLGFASDAFGGDPLRRPVLYMGQWSGLGSLAAEGLLESWLLWLLGALALLGALLRSSGRERGEG